MNASCSATSIVPPPSAAVPGGNGQLWDVIILGAGASGLMCAIEAGKRGRKVLVLDHGRGPGRKILMAGGGKCNFTNLDVQAKHYVSGNPHFCKSALSRFSPWNFLELVASHHIEYEERLHGQLFCRHKAHDILEMLLTEAMKAKAHIRLQCQILSVAQQGERSFQVCTSQGEFACASLVVATGGLSIPPSGTSPLGYRLAEQFGLAVRPLSAGLVPFTLHPQDKERFEGLSGIAVPATLNLGRISFTENLLFTHRGLSGPAALQASNYWEQGQELSIDLLPGRDLAAWLESRTGEDPRKQVRTVLAELLPRRLVEALVPAELGDYRLCALGRVQVAEIVRSLQAWTVKPAGTEGYRTAEVTRGGVDCDALSSKTMEALAVPGLFFVGEVVDVTGWLGGYNLQWAWSSGWCAGQYA